MGSITLILRSFLVAERMAEWGLPLIHYAPIYVSKFINGRESIYCTKTIANWERQFVSGDNLYLQIIWTNCEDAIVGVNVN